MLENWKMLLQEEAAPLLVNLLLLKKMNELFEEERKTIRIDFLVRGICEKEVDGLLEDEGLYKMVYISPNLRWERLLGAPENEVRSILIEMMRAQGRNIAAVPDNISDSAIMRYIQTIQAEVCLCSLEEVEAFYHVVRDNNNSHS